MSKPFTPQDKFFFKAKSKGFRARSAFKLAEIQEKFNIFHTGMDVLDLGASPGSWLQYVYSITGPNSRLIGVDITPIKPLNKAVTTLVADITASNCCDLIRSIHPEKFQVVISDVAPSTTGIKVVDHLRSIELTTSVLHIAHELLQPTGILIMKVFQGSEFDSLLKQCKQYFTKTSVYKPKSSRDRSRETYIIALHKQPAVGTN